MRLRPFTLELARLAAAGDRAALGAALGVHVPEEWPAPGFQRVIPLLVLQFTEAPELAAWVFLAEQDGEIVGEIGAKSLPVLGGVEVGYGVVPSARGRGAATAALRLFVAEMFLRGAQAVYAEVLDVNLASIRVVQKVGFRWMRPDASDDGPVGWWELVRSTTPAPAPRAP